MNTDPKHALRVPHLELRDFVTRMLTAMRMPADHADFVAGMLDQCDLRGTYSHGSWLMGWYTDYCLSGQLNLQPEVRVDRESPVSITLDGDNGLGYFPLHRGMEAIIEKAKTTGMAACATFHHEHIGAAGNYARMALEHDMIAFVTTGHQLTLDTKKHLEKGRSDLHRKHILAGGGSAMAFAAPANEEPHFVLDFGAMHDLYNPRLADRLFKMAPGLVLRTIGLGEVTQIFGAMLAGIPSHPSRSEHRDEGPRKLEQGAFAFVARVDLFTDAATFKAEIDDYARQVANLIPFKGLERCYLPGGIEAERMERNRRDGIPLDQRHRETIEHAAARIGIKVPWQAGATA